MTENLHYILREPMIKTDNPSVLFMLHGYGSNEQDLFSFAPHLPDELLIVSLQAPISMGFGSYAWFEINFEAELGMRSNIIQAKQSLILIENLINDIIKKYSVNQNKSFLLGFSQGSFLSFAYAFKNPNIINNYICLSGYMKEEILKEFAFKNRYNELDFFVSHGTQDQIIPIDWAREIPIILEKYKAKYTYKEYPIGHGVSQENFVDFKLWIEKRLNNN
jgi:phospholipase/carboxylesterase